MNSLKPVLISFTALLCLTATAYGQTLTEAMRMAQENTPDLTSADLATRIAAERVIQAQAQGKTQITLESGLSWQNVESNAPFNFNAGDTLGASTTITAARPIYTGGLIRAGVEAAQSATLAQEALGGSTEQEILYRTIEAYLGVWRDRQGVELAKNAKDLALSQLQQAQDSFDAGVITRTDVALAEANLAQSTAQISLRETQLRISAAHFSYLVGEAPGELSAPIAFLGVPPSLDLALERLRAENPALKALAYQGKSLANLTDQAKAAYRPQISVGASTGYGRELRDDTYEASIGASVGLSLPIYTSGQRKSTVKQAELEALQNDAEIAKTQGQLTVELTRLWQIRLATRVVTQAAEAQVVALEQAFAGAKAEFEFGARPWIDVLDARQNLFTARQSLIDARYDNLVASAGVLRLLGRLNPEAVA